MYIQYLQYISLYLFLFTVVALGTYECNIFSPSSLLPFLTPSLPHSFPSLPSLSSLPSLPSLFVQVLCVGPTGTGKTLTTTDKLLKGMSPDYLSHFITFSARTSANQTQDIIDSKLDKR